ncbi:ochre suppressor tyr-tRNA [Fusarium pseudocircinatum]|uniref:Ochre suppressor tyr-tRNA n=1 Tax=Fusarium pseudocircinatum TaxID=56676 RepID=A0A8H5PWJ4_9HYPO|nr:ochre suppressor tyr-tRNA [Fusarium pseudocircinatum]
MRGICHAMNHNHNHDDSSHPSFTKTSQLKASSPRLARQIANADQKPQSTRYSEMLPANIIAKGQTRPAILYFLVLWLMEFCFDQYNFGDHISVAGEAPHSSATRGVARPGRIRNLRQPRIAAPDAPEQPEISRKAITYSHCGRHNGFQRVETNLLTCVEGTDASRSKIVELQLQARVAEELRKLQQKEAEALKIAHEKLASADFKDDNSTSQYTVSKEIEAMRKKLESRKQVRPLPESVEGARNEVIRCLREHDRRPLDCWQEVENFKAEVKKLEKSWVEKVVS